MKNQIEEMAELERLLRIRRMDIEKQGCDIWALIKKTESEEQSIADYLIGQGYRKAYEVAREIFEKVERAFGGAHMLWYHTRPGEYEEYEKIKKKYIGEDTNVHTNTEGGK
jgi:hypothetical protein